MTDEAPVGYYDLYQISSTRKTKRAKEHNGIFPYHPNTIMNWVKSGEFPKPIKGLGSRNLWSKDAIHQLVEALRAGMWPPKGKRKEAP